MSGTEPSGKRRTRRNAEGPSKLRVVSTIPLGLFGPPRGFRPLVRRRQYAVLVRVRHRAEERLVATGLREDVFGTSAMSVFRDARVREVEGI